ncbi:hypothetical protein GE21DRAFT_6955 [Neurospora crassa]|uniref:Uncharacterized protein n=1 Tax=Neurospora crassa (strain ATCC 24698 / 74-OR23-1A / CBS 708.71 / DSM 1257 / FGSC 987) TaxID=367110 RepID=V5IMH1_NEUCR|nr:hypothetical protein NCU16929 [Neurospora crassa OR74A]ESA42369.1 hypothetical protein NCU16929 [Neurospora crassa OR74A]KHE81117.1 hypothetical protein GE21DRAFT_6955 [Neurospora crassa]|eukprot:XP_011394809.1 hypothetical protein NCU16929 [Neurospora crassa OR74A]
MNFKCCLRFDQCEFSVCTVQRHRDKDISRRRLRPLHSLQASQQLSRPYINQSSLDNSLHQVRRPPPSKTVQAHFDSLVSQQLPLSGTMTATNFHCGQLQRRFPLPRAGFPDSDRQSGQRSPTSQSPLVGQTVRSRESSAAPRKVSLSLQFVSSSCFEYLWCR